MIYRGVLALSVLGSFGIGACALQASEPGTRAADGDSTHEVATEATAFTQTVVHFEADHSKRVEVFVRSALDTEKSPGAAASTPAASGSMHLDAVRPPPSIIRPSPCLGADLFLWDQTNGRGNSICFFGIAGLEVDFSLADYPRTSTTTWSGAVRSVVASVYPNRVISFYGVDQNEDGADAGPICATFNVGSGSRIDDYYCLPSVYDVKIKK